MTGSYKFTEIGDLKEMSIRVVEETNPQVARIIVKLNLFNNEDAVLILNKVYDNWPKGKKVEFIITCGGFIEFKWPEKISKYDIGNVLKPNTSAIKVIEEEGERCIRELLAPELLNKLSKITNNITIGADSYLYTENEFDRSIELVYIINLKNNTISVTGKIYPTPEQQSYLLRILDCNSHFIDIDNSTLMVLGCHDMNMFSNRSAHNAKGWRKNTIIKFRKFSNGKKPSLVLHHPHYTDSIRIWSTAFGGLKKELPGIKFASAGRYYNNKGESPRSPIKNVLAKTKNISTIDFVVGIA